jgi:hypothetical protein
MFRLEKNKNKNLIVLTGKFIKMASDLKYIAKNKRRLDLILI